MTDRETLYNGLSHAAWGYFFLNFDFNLGTVSILPQFVGFLLLLSAIGELSGERRDLMLLQPLCILLSAWSGVDWVLKCFGEDLDGKLIFLDLLTAAAALYFHYQFLTDMAALAEKYPPEEGDLAGRIRRHRTAFTITVTAVNLLGSLFRAIPWEGWSGVMVAAAVIACIVAVLIMADLFRLRKGVRGGEPEEGE